MGDLIKEEHILRVEELVWGPASWPKRLRICVPQPTRETARSSMEPSAREGVERAMEYLSSPFCGGRLAPSLVRERPN
jgi:hypothetical protein